MARIEQARAPFEQIAHAIEERIARGELVGGDRIPSQRELVEEWDVSKATANKAVAALKARGFIETRVGAGAQVAQNARALTAGPADQLRRAQREGRLYPPGVTSTIYAGAIVSAYDVSSDVLEAVGLNRPSQTAAGEANKVIQRARIMNRDGVPYAACTTWFSWPLIAQQPGGDELIDRLASVGTRFTTEGGTGMAVARFLDQEITHTIDRVGVRPMPLRIARELGVEPGTRVLWLLTARCGGEYVIEVDEWFYIDPNADVTYSREL